MPVPPNLKLRAVRRLLRMFVGLAAMILIPAGSWKFWQGWSYLGVNAVLQSALMIYFYWRDPEVLGRRLLTREQNREQKFIIVMLRLVTVSTFVLSGLDYRFGWSANSNFQVPPWLTMLALLVIIGNQFFFLLVLRANRFAASIIQVENGQTIARTGPYHWVRHPMYTGMVIHGMVAPLALGSAVGLVPGILVAPTLVLRLLHEEKVLRRDLPGYDEYCEQTPRRLIPYIW